MIPPILEPHVLDGTDIGCVSGDATLDEYTARCRLPEPLPFDEMLTTDLPHTASRIRTQIFEDEFTRHRLRRLFVRSRTRPLYRLVRPENKFEKWG